jgi:hypothetical protein
MSETGGDAHPDRGLAAHDNQSAPRPRGPYLVERFPGEKPAAITATAPTRPPANYRLQGVAAALGALAREHLEPDLAATVLASLALTVTDLEAAGADP